MVDTHGIQTVRELIKSDSRFFLKSEYGPFSDDWPVLAFSNPRLGVMLRRDFRTGVDFVLITGTMGPETAEEEHRGRLLSLVSINKTKIYRTSEQVSPQLWEWADKNYPGQWTTCFRGEGWDLIDLPRSSDIVSIAYSKMGRYPYRGNVCELTGDERDRLMDLRISKVTISYIPGREEKTTQEAILEDKALNIEATRIAGLVFNRVAVSGEQLQRTAPTRTAPTDLIFHVAEMLRVTPLTCTLCGGIILLNPQNKLLQPSPDRIDSGNGDYGPANFQLSHLGCNYAKNRYSVDQFKEWLRFAIEATFEE
jgi:hypothetical protein